MIAVIAFELLLLILSIYTCRKGKELLTAKGVEVIKQYEKDCSLKKYNILVLFLMFIIKILGTIFEVPPFIYQNTCTVIVLGYMVYVIYNLEQIPITTEFKGYYSTSAISFFFIWLTFVYAL